MSEAREPAVGDADRDSGVVLATSAHAKINLSLEIVGTRADGFHEIVSVTQLISLADTVEVSAADVLSVDVQPPLTDGGENIARRAAHALAASIGRVPAVRVRIVKQIPVAAGLGGGSSDAAATLRLLARLWEAGLGRETLPEIGASLGSDVPLFLCGGTSLIRGRGERVERLPAPPRFWVLLVCPALAPAEKTRSLYRALSSGDLGTGATTESLADAIRLGRSVVELPCVNSFDAAASRVYAGFSELRERVSRAIGQPAHLTGAGPTLFATFDSEAEARSAANAVVGLGHRTVVARSIARASRIRVRRTPVQPPARSSDG